MYPRIGTLQVSCIWSIDDFIPCKLVASKKLVWVLKFSPEIPSHRSIFCVT
jgi:hypothetical protein